MFARAIETSSIWLFVGKMRGAWGGGGTVRIVFPARILKINVFSQEFKTGEQCFRQCYALNVATCWIHVSNLS